ADARQRLHAVAGVEARRVDEVLEPGPPRQAFPRQRPLAPEQDDVDLRGRLAAELDPAPRLLVLLGALLEPRDGVLQRREIEVRHRRLRLRREEGLPGI